MVYMTTIHYSSLFVAQGEANLKFVFFIMQQLDKTVPSITSVKNITLEGLVSPRQVHVYVYTNV